jgi:regulator of sirC expression with transglutaminase-like and TPR domain
MGYDVDLPILERIRRDIDRDTYHPFVPSLFVLNSEKLGAEIDIEASVDTFKRTRDLEVVLDSAEEFTRTLDRTTLLREEFERAYPRWRAVLNCKHIKEELMQKAWHPRRVGHVLETYGWEALENLLGE